MAYHIVRFFSFAFLDKFPSSSRPRLPRDRVLGPEGSSYLALALSPGTRLTYWYRGRESRVDCRLTNTVKQTLFATTYVPMPPATAISYLIDLVIRFIVAHRLISQGYSRDHMGHVPEMKKTNEAETPAAKRKEGVKRSILKRKREKKMAGLCKIASVGKALHKSAHSGHPIGTQEAEGTDYGSCVLTALC